MARNNSELFHSISSFFMNHYNCPKSVTGYYALECGSGQCESHKYIDCAVPDLDLNEEI